MTDHDMTAGAAAKPCIALLGEFSAGKSALANALLGQDNSPMRATATQVPPIWYCAGSGEPVRIATDGTETAIARDEVDRTPVRGTKAVRVFLGADFLDAVDLIDMPGSSDPNMSPDIWDALLPVADMVLWCTPAAQAWRQSEAAIWEDVPEAVKMRSLLLLTRIDTVRTEADRTKLLARVRRETAGQFRAVLPVSPLLALEAGEDRDRQQASGLPRLVDLLAEIIEELRAPPRADNADLARGLRRSRAGDGALDGPRDAAAGTTAAGGPGAVPCDPAASEAAEQVVPRRVRPGGETGGPVRHRPRQELI